MDDLQKKYVGKDPALTNKAEGFGAGNQAILQRMRRNTDWNKDGDHYTVAIRHEDVERYRKFFEDMAADLRERGMDFKEAERVHVTSYYDPADMQKKPAHEAEIRLSAEDMNLLQISPVAVRRR